ncbi:hypothetical protein QBC46DRAFT_445354 [Diplogelasinospora grovesii]|uniref:Uncharacterized protein n=1 Tax=Diplogelasinospora grovesii TaxID=303347 RepID=A0AAN6NHZ8_9PEZI|nr:hypothetical protein QBC46DRAFT_445354 [Diplogelasinospora grovesii]
MHVSTAYYLFLLGSSVASAAAILPRQAAAETEAWVTVDESGVPKTVTPVVSTINGTPTIISGAPHDVTATVFTRTANAVVTTSTGDAAASTPTAADSSGSGAFATCQNTDASNYAPFCTPANNATLYPGSTYYITWNPSYFDAANTTVKVMGFYNDNQTEQAFSSSSMAAGWGFYQWPVTNDLLSTKHANAVNITIRIAALPTFSGNSSTPVASAKWIPGPTAVVMYSPTPAPPKAEMPTGPALYIGLPTIVGFVLVVAVGTCVWNRKARRIDIGNIMSRGRRGYGVGKSRTQRMLGKSISSRRRNKEQAIRLMDRNVHDTEEGEEGGLYRDELQQHHQQQWPAQKGGGYQVQVQQHEGGRPRRDSDSLGSLAGDITPTEEDRRMDFDFDLHLPSHRPQQQHETSNNAFRNELGRQDRERF